jgi:SAM-dependent methyltransferase
MKESCAAPSEKKSGFYELLSFSKVYDGVQNLVGVSQLRKEIIQTYIKPKAQERMLDIGCGTAEILNHLPDVEYDGFDMNAGYIRQAQLRYGNRGNFKCQRVSDQALSGIEPYDIVLAFGIIHHLNDHESCQLFEIARRALKPTGRLITIDPCFSPNQSWLARQMVKRDRGDCVRFVENYEMLAKSAFRTVQTTTRYDLIKIPFTHCIMECYDPNIS